MGWFDKIWRKPATTPAEQKVPTYQEVFTASIPTLSYYERLSGRYEKLLAALLDQPGSVVSVYGPSKCGKTSLVIRVLAQRRSLVVGCRIDESEESLWRRIANELKIPVAFSQSNETAAGTAAGSEVIGLKATAGVKQSIVQTHDILVREAALKRLAEDNYTLVVDDVHFLAPETVRTLLSTLKQYALGASVVLISTFSDQDLSGRYQVNMDARGKKLQLKTWESTEIATHLERCFALLSMAIDASTIDSISRRSYGNPLIANNCGYYFCYRKATDPTFVYEENSFFRAAIEDGFLTGNRELFNRLVVGTNRQASDRNIYEFDRTHRGDIYFGIMLALKKFGAVDQVGKRTLYEKISSSITKFERGTGLQESQVTQALAVLSRTARTIAAGESDDSNRDISLEWDEHQSRLRLGDPGLKLYIAFADWEREQQDRYLTVERSNNSRGTATT